MLASRPAAGDREREDDPARPDQLVAGEDHGAEHHRCHDRSHVRLEQVGAHAGHVADVVADVVGDHGRVARVILRDPRFDLADEVRTDVRGLGVDAAADAREQRDVLAPRPNAAISAWNSAPRSR